MSSLPSLDELKQIAKTCRQCDKCQRNCPQDYNIPKAIKAAGEGDISLLTDLYETCIGCGRCEEACPEKIMIHSLIIKAGEKQMLSEDNLCRVGRGAFQDTEIRNVGSPIVRRRNPRNRCRRLQQLSKKAAKTSTTSAENSSRRYIVVLSGCSAMSAGQLPQQRRQNAI